MPIRFEAPKNWEHLATILAYGGDRLVGMAKLSRDGTNATLQDILIQDIRLPIFRFITWPKKRYNYRGHGYGSSLLEETILYCRRHRIAVLEGEAVGDLARLIPWYKRHGFEIYGHNKIKFQFDV